MGAYTQKTFAGGMDLNTEITRLEGERYPLLINGRARFGVVRPTKAPLQLTEGLPLPANSTYQGLFAAGNYAVVVAGGKCYVRDYSIPSSAFYSVPSFNLSPSATEVWCSLVPASTLNFGRTAEDDKPNTVINLLTGAIAPSPECAVFQDGVTQPMILLSDGTARQALGYKQWTQEAREYVPIGKQMIWSPDDNIHYIASPNGRELYRSVNGRPLDFVVAVDVNGDRVDALEEQGGASAVSHRVSYSAITCLGKVQSTDGGIFVGTKYNGFMVIPDYTQTLYAEPKFRQVTMVNTGTNNNNSFLGDVNGDSMSIDNTGIRSFNAIRQFKTEGINSPFSLAVSKLFQNPRDRNEFLTQTVTAATLFNNYAIFAVTTGYGNALLFYDTLTQVWESLDIYEDIGSIRQFAEIRTTNNTHKLLFLTTDGKVYEAFGSSNIDAQLYIGDFCSGNPDIQAKVDSIRVVLNNTLTDGTFNATVFIDGVNSGISLSKPVKQTQVIADTLTVPVGTQTGQGNNLAFDFNRALQGFRVGVLFTWSVDSELTHLVINTKEVGMTNTPGSQVSEYDATKEFLAAQRV